MTLLALLAGAVLGWWAARAYATYRALRKLRYSSGEAAREILSRVWGERE